MILLKQELKFKMEYTNLTNKDLFEQTQICIREMQNRGLSFIDLKINFSERDLNDLQNDKEFNWTFEGVNLNLFKEETI